jgi:hypothetical protein
VRPPYWSGKYCLFNHSHWALLPRLPATPCLGELLPTFGHCLPKHYHKHCLFVPLCLYYLRLPITDYTKCLCSGMPHRLLGIACLTTLTGHCCLVYLPPLAWVCHYVPVGTACPTTTTNTACLFLLLFNICRLPITGYTKMLVFGNAPIDL